MDKERRPTRSGLVKGWTQIANPGPTSLKAVKVTLIQSAMQANLKERELAGQVKVKQ